MFRNIGLPIQVMEASIGDRINSGMPVAKVLVIGFTSYDIL